MGDNETVRAAMARIYAHSGWKLFPCWWIEDGVCACHHGTACNSPGKHPIFPPAHPRDAPERSTCRGECGRPGHGVWDATADPDTISRWWRQHPMAHIGLPADLNGLAILDVDPKSGGRESFRRLRDRMLTKGVDLVDTLTQRTGSGGYHYLYKAPEGGVKSTARSFGPDMPGLDTRGRGGYIIVAPSGHISGGAYEWVNFFADPAPWPALLSKLMEPPRPKPVPYRGPRKRPTDRYAASALDRETATVAAAPQGTRNNALNRAAFNLGQLVGAGALDEGAVRVELLRAATACGLSESEAVRTILSGLRNGKEKPREVRA